MSFLILKNYKKLTIKYSKFDLISLLAYEIKSINANNFLKKLSLKFYIVWPSLNETLICHIYLYDFDIGIKWNNL